MVQRHHRNGILLAVVLGATLIVGVVSAEISTDQDSETGLRSWKWGQRGISLQFLQLLPDQTRAFFLGRGFNAEYADMIGRSCVFQTIFRNQGGLPVEYDLSDWSILHRGKRLPLRSRSFWDSEWEVRQIEEGARIAFRWALLPTIQRFEPGDYNWGMTVFGLPPGQQFDLSMIVTVGGKPITAEIPSVLCATDRYLWTTTRR